MIKGHVDFRVLNQHAPLNLDVLFNTVNKPLAVSVEGLDVCVAPFASVNVRFLTQDSRLLVIMGSPRIREARLLQTVRHEGWLPMLPWFFADLKGMAQKLGGHFGLLLVDFKSGVVGAVSDRFNTYPFYYAQEGSRLSFAGHAGAVPVRDRSLDTQGVFNTLCFQSPCAPRTLFAKVKRLSTGSWLKVSENAEESDLWCSPWFDEPPKANLLTQSERFLTLLNEAIHTEVRPYAAVAQQKVGVLLSGSSASAGLSVLLSEQMKVAANTYSVHFEGQDDWPVKLIEQGLGVNHHTLVMTEEALVSRLPALVGALDQPFCSASVLRTIFAAECAQKEGIERLLTDDGIAEFLGDKACYTQQRMLERYHLVPQVVRSLVQPLLTPFKRFAYGAIRAKKRLPARFWCENITNCFEQKEVFTRTFLQQIDVSAPDIFQRAMWDSMREKMNAKSLINKLLAFDMHFSATESTLPHLFCVNYPTGITIETPFLNDDVVDFTMELPPEFKLRGLNHGWFLTQILKKILPARLLRKQAQELPLKVWLQNEGPFKQLAQACLSSLAKRGILHEDFERSVSESFHSASCVCVWTMVTLALWLNANAPEFNDLSAPALVGDGAVDLQEKT